MPRNRSRTLGASSAAPPYAASTCIQRSRVGAHRGDAGEIVDEAGVRRAGGGDDREDELGSASAASAAASVGAGQAVVVGRRRRAARTSRSRIVFAIDECVCSLTAMRSGDRAAAPRRARCRARPRARRGSRPSRPARSTPPAPAGRPARSARKRSAWFSACTAPAASNHEMPDSDDADTTMSKSSDAFVGAAGMNARNRGLSHEMTASGEHVA